jgi:hypothetical protein
LEHFAFCFVTLTLCDSPVALGKVTALFPLHGKSRQLKNSKASISLNPSPNLVNKRKKKNLLKKDPKKMKTQYYSSCATLQSRFHFFLDSGTPTCSMSTTIERPF